MSVDFETVKSKIEQKLPEMLPKAVKWVLVHLLMLLYHFRMPIWVTALKASRTAKNFALKQSDKIPAASESAALHHGKLRARRDARRSEREETHF